MQKILRRVATAERVAAKRKAKETKTHEMRQRKQTIMMRQQQFKEVNKDYQRAKQTIKDDWNLGPLAPNPHYGQFANTFGAIGENRYMMYGDLTPDQRKERYKWMGGGRMNLKVGDRVVLLEGPDKGKIGKVQRLNEDKATVTVEGLNKSNIRMPTELLSEDGPVGINFEIPMPVSGVRLVHPITDPDTGKTRDVIINQLRSVNVVHDNYTKETFWDRMVPGLNIIIPWPQEPAGEKTEHKVDTIRIDVEARTFVPTLLRPPMPETVIDELRNRYSRFRTRHEPEYVARKEAEEQAKKDRAKLMDSMRTPLQEFHRAERERKKKKGKPRLTIEMLEEIGKVIAKNRRLTINAADVSLDIPPSSTSSSSAAPLLPPSSSDAETPPPPSSSS